MNREDPEQEIRRRLFWIVVLILAAVATVGCGVLSLWHAAEWGRR